MTIYEETWYMPYCLDYCHCGSEWRTRAEAERQMTMMKAREPDYRFAVKTVRKIVCQK